MGLSLPGLVGGRGHDAVHAEGGGADAVVIITQQTDPRRLARGILLPLTGLVPL